MIKNYYKIKFLIFKYFFIQKDKKVLLIKELNLSSFNIKYNLCIILGQIENKKYM
jgi:hypothetical protein